MLTLFDFAEVAIQEQQAPIGQYTETEAVKVALMTVKQALKDAKQKSRPEECQQAREWLFTVGLEWVRAVRENITADQLHRMIDNPNRCSSCRAFKKCRHAVRPPDTEYTPARVSVSAETRRYKKKEVLRVENGLTRQQDLFVKAFLQSWDPGKAARKAGYAHPGSSGLAILKNPLVIQEIKEWAQEQKRSAGEALLKLALPAAASIGEFLTLEQAPALDQVGNRVIDTATGKSQQQTVAVGIDLEKVKRRGYLVKETVDREEGRHNYELFDVRGALERLGKRAELFLKLTGWILTTCPRTWL